MLDGAENWLKLALCNTTKINLMKNLSIQFKYFTLKTKRTKNLEQKMECYNTHLAGKKFFFLQYFIAPTLE